jgi:type I restriction enzyme R subunit
VEQLRAAAEQKVREMAARNPSRVDLIEKLEALIDAYNAATDNVTETFERLKEYLRTLDAEEGRAAREGLSEDELAIYDLLTRPAPNLTAAQAVQVKKIARDLLAKLQDKVSAFQWRQRQQTRGDVRWTIEQVLNALPEAPYPKDLWDEKVEATWQFVFARPDAAAGVGRMA